MPVCLCVWVHVSFMYMCACVALNLHASVRSCVCVCVGVRGVPVCVRGASSGPSYPGFTALSVLPPEPGDLGQMSQSLWPSLPSPGTWGRGRPPCKTEMMSVAPRTCLARGRNLGHVRSPNFPAQGSRTQLISVTGTILTPSAGHSPSPASSKKLPHPAPCNPGNPLSTPAAPAT